MMLYKPSSAAGAGDLQLALNRQRFSRWVVPHTVGRW